MGDGLCLVRQRLWSKMQHKSAASSDLLPSLGIVVGGTLWGIYWLPLRALGEQGLGPGWSGAALYSILLVLLAPFAYRRRRELKAGGLALLLTGLLTGAAFALYAAAILLTEVVRVLLLFYLTPVWSTLLGMFLLGERLTLNRALALAVGFVGLLVVLGLGSQIPWPRNVGDWMALAAGILWAYGSLRVYRGGQTATFEQIFVFVFGGAVTSVACIVLFTDLMGPPPTEAQLAGIIPWVAVASLLMIPMLALTIWPATRLSPARIGILLMAEIVVGVSSAALLSGEPFGLRELSGTLLILAAGIVEVWRPPAKQAPS